MLPRVREPAQEGYEGRSGQAAGADKGQGVQERPHEGPRGRLRSRSCPDGNSGSTGRLLPPRPPCRGRQPGPHPSARPASARLLPSWTPAPHTLAPAQLPRCLAARKQTRGHAATRPHVLPERHHDGRGGPSPGPALPTSLSLDGTRKTRSRRQLPCEGRGRRPPRGGGQTRVWRAPPAERGVLDLPR